MQECYLKCPMISNDTKEWVKNLVELLKNDLINFNSSFSDLKLVWTNFMIVEYDYLGEFSNQFSVTPENYLQFAKQGFLDRSTKGLIDAMSNAKRAIESQIDSIILFLGYNYKTFDKRTTYSKTKEFITNNFKDDNTDGITDRIKLLQILNISPSFLMSKIRSLRNKVEHEYIIPEIHEVKEAIEIADLFINSSMRKMAWINRLISFGSNFKDEIHERYDGSSYTFSHLYPVYMCFEIDHIHKEAKTLITVTTIRKNNKMYPYDEEEVSNNKYIVDSECELYPLILFIFFTKQYHILLDVFSVNIDKKHIKYIVQEA